MEPIYWRADLYKEINGGWYRVDATKPWLYAVANSSTILPLNYYRWFTRPDRALGSAVTWLKFGNLSAGMYAVYETYQWKDGRQHNEWAAFSWNNTTSPLCAVS